MAGNLGYSKLTYTDIVNQITSKLNSDPMFQTFRESSASKTILELFSGMTDIINYYIERRAEESFLETAKLRSSVIQGSKQLGYIIQRQVPAQASISITMKGDDSVWDDVELEDVIQLPIYSSFTYGGNKFLLKAVYTYTFTEEDLANLKNDPNYTKTIQYGLLNNERNYNLYKDEDLVEESDLVTIDIIQSERKYYFIDGATNEQIGKKFQVYNIPDNTFSNLYGDEDLDLPLTKVACSNFGYNIFDPVNSFTGDTSALEYTIDRRSLLQRGQLLDLTADPVKVCLMKTNQDETMDLMFGDNIYAEIGAELGDKDNVSIQYISTLGAKGNKVGVVGAKITYNDTIITSPSNIDVTQQIEFNLTTDIIGGADMESTASVKNNAPAIYYSLDRCVIAGDYIAYLKTLTTPINIQNAMAWGEQEEGGNSTPIPKLFNVALFSCFGQMYNYNANIDKWSAKESDTSEGGGLSDAVLDDVDLFGQSVGGSAIPDNHYFYVLTVSASPGNSRNIENASIALPTSKLGKVYTALKSRSMMTVKNIYVSPMIQEYDLKGKIYINKMADADALLTKIRNDIYSFLNVNADFNTPVRQSNLIELIDDNQGVLYSNVELVPTEISARETLGVAGQTVYDAVLNDNSISQWLGTFNEDQIDITSNYYTLSADIAVVFQGMFLLTSIDENLDNVKNQDMSLSYKHQMTEDWFWNIFVKTIYDFMNQDPPFVFGPFTLTVDGFAGFAGTMWWDQLIMKIHNMFSYAIRYNTMVDTDSNGVRTKIDDIVHYTLRTEIPKITFEAGVIYK